MAELARSTGLGVLDPTKRAERDGVLAAVSLGERTATLSLATAGDGVGVELHLLDVSEWAQGAAAAPVRTFDDPFGGLVRA